MPGSWASNTQNVIDYSVMCECCHEEFCVIV